MPKNIEYTTDAKSKVSKMKDLLAEMQDSVMAENVPHEVKSRVLENTILIWRLLKYNE